MGNIIVFGASPNSLRHANKAVKSLIRHNKNVVPLGFRTGTISGISILTGKPEIKDVDTILLYVGAQRQIDYYNYLIKLKPKKVVFNPGTENQEFQDILQEEGIEIIVACALVMINSGQL